LEKGLDLGTARNGRCLQFRPLPFFGFRFQPRIEIGLAHQLAVFEDDYFDFGGIGEAEAAQ
jgi:hypothetical protein